MSEARAQRDRRLIQRTAALLSEDYPLDQLIARVCDVLNSEFGASVSFVAIAQDAAALRVVAIATESASMVLAPTVPEGSPAHAVYVSGEAVLLSSLDDAQRYHAFTVEGVESQIIAPVTYRERPLGVIAVCSTDARAYDEADLKLLQAIARYLAIAVRNQRIPESAGVPWRGSAWGVIIVALVAIVLTVAIGSYSAYRSNEAGRAARDLALSRLRSAAAQLEDYVEDARQLSSSAVQLAGNAHGDPAQVEDTIRRLLQSATSPSVYGIGIWYEPYAFDGKTRLYGPYGHWDANHHLVITHEWMRPSYDYPSQAWYRQGVAAKGHLVYTKPYFDTDHVYVSAVRAFYDSSGKLRGTVTADSILPNLEGVMRLAGGEGAFTYVTAADGTIVLTSDDEGLLTYAREHGQQAASVLDVWPDTLVAYEHHLLGNDVLQIPMVLPYTDWHLGVAIDRGIIEADARRFRDVSYAAIASIWLAAFLAIFALVRSGRHVQRARVLEAQQHALEVEIAERIRAEERLRERAFRDELTQLPNRAFVLTQLESRLQRVRQNADDMFAVLFIDLDRFNIVNDSLGHATGDVLLSEIAQRLRVLARSGDILARLGGDEFVLLLEHANEGVVRTRAAEVLQTLRHPFALSGHEFYITASIGIAIGDERYVTPEEPLRDADAAMYEAKRAGRATFRIFDQSMHANAMERLALETDLRRALVRGEIFVEYQPLVSLIDGKVAGFEALARWRHPTRGRIMPDVFIKLAEQSGLIVDIDERVMAEAAATVQGWRAEFPHLFVAVNLSAAHLARVDDLAAVRRAIEATGLPPSALKVELTETAIMENGEKALGVLVRMREMGVSVVIDDFGTGYSSLSYLQQLPIEEIKIDRSFVGSMLKSEKSAEIVRAIMAIAKTLHLAVTAEGVENEEEARRLTRLGVEYAQGYIYGMAVDAQAAYRLLRARSSERSLGV